MKFIIQNKYLSECLHLIFPNKFEIKHKTETRRSATYLYVFFYIDTHERLQTRIFDKRDDFNFPISKARIISYVFFLTFLVYRIN